MIQSKVYTYVPAKIKPKGKTSSVETASESAVIDVKIVVIVVKLGIFTVYAKIPIHD